MHSSTLPRGDLHLRVIRDEPERPARVRLADGLPQRGLPDVVNEWRLINSRRLIKPLAKIRMAEKIGVAHMYGALYLKLFREDKEYDLGLASLKLVTTAGVTFLATRFVDGNTSIGNFDFHGFGTGGTAEAIGDTALVTELTTQYNPDSTRPTGTPSNPSVNVYRSVGTLSPDTGGTIAITEHGLFSASSAGTLWDRSLFAAVNLVAGTDSLQATYDGTFAAGG